jgi:hypothetical protein
VSVLVYNGINLGLLRTQYMQWQPALDAVGNVDPLCTHVVLEVTSIMHPNVVASNIVPGAGPGGIPQGDLAGLSAANLREALMQPRRPLVYEIGPDFVVISPQFQNGAFLNRDKRDGPNVLECRVTQVEGDFNFLIIFKVETWVSAFSNVLRSNRWAMTHIVDQYGMTTRVVQGQAVIRGDAIPFSGVQSADDFRRFLFLPIPNNFKRDKINCEISPDGIVLSYTVIDRETGLALGPNSVAITTKGNATAGSESTIKTIRQATNFLLGQSANGLHLDVIAFLKKSLDTAVPISKANVLIRVQGNRGATRVALARLAAAIALDRMNSALIVSAYCSQSLDSDQTPWVEVRVEFFPGARAIVGGALHPLNFRNQMNLSDNIAGGRGGIFGVGVPFAFPIGPAINPPITSNNPQGVNPPLPAGDGARGSYIGAMAVQVFANPGAVPNAPPPDAPAQIVNPI